MRDGGKGGSRTQTGAAFENLHTDLLHFLQGSDSYIQEGNNIYARQGQVRKDDNVIAKLYHKNKFYSEFLKNADVDYTRIISRRIIPDVVVEVIDTKFLAIIEAKFQKNPGSTDEKIQTCDFKQKQFRKLIPANYKFKYIYLLNKWFKDKKGYADDLRYIKKTENCDYCIEQIPNDYIPGLGNK